MLIKVGRFTAVVFNNEIYQMEKAIGRFMIENHIYPEDPKSLKKITGDNTECIVKSVLARN
jgi:hypothetical protein